MQIVKKLIYTRGNLVKMEGWEKIFEKAHLNESSDLAREYFTKCGLNFLDVNLDNCKKLRQLINLECYKLLDDENYSMIKDLDVNLKIKKDKWGIYLTARGSYFSEREAISFYNPKTNDKTMTIGFCGWASGCNRIPFIKGFIKWCDWMKEKKNKMEKTKKLSKIELIKECQRLMLKNDYSVMSAKIIGDFMKRNLETNRDYYLKHKENFEKIRKDAFKSLPKKVKKKLKNE